MESTDFALVPRIIDENPENANIGSRPFPENRRKEKEREQDKIILKQVGGGIFLFLAGFRGGLPFLFAMSGRRVKTLSLA